MNTTITSGWLERFRDSEIEIHYLTDNNAYKDRGRLVDYGDGWIELFKPEAGEQGETFVIPATSVRIMKILKTPKTLKADEARLLRAVEAPRIEPKPELDEYDNDSAVNRLRR